MIFPQSHDPPLCARPHGRARHELRLDVDPFRRCGGVRDAREQYLDHAVGLVGDKGVNRRQRGGEEAGFERVVQPDDGDVAPDGEAASRRLPAGRKGDDVVVAEDGRGALLAREQVGHPLIAPLDETGPLVHGGFGQPGCPSPGAAIREAMRREIPADQARRRLARALRSIVPPSAEHPPLAVRAGTTDPADLVPFAAAPQDALETVFGAADALDGVVLAFLGPLCEEAGEGARDVRENAERRLAALPDDDSSPDSIIERIGILRDLDRREDADALVGTIHEHQRRFGALWDHWECGFRYTRPLSSWTTMPAASGLSVDAEQKILRLEPRELPLTIPVITCFCSAVAVFDEKSCILTVHEGSLDGWTVECPAGTEVVIRNGQ